MTFALVLRTSLLGALLAACSTETVGSAPPAPVDWRSLERRPRPDASVGPTIRERAIAEAYATAVASTDLASLAAHLDADARLFFPGVMDVRGREAVVRGHELLFGAFVDRRVAVRRVLRTSTTQLVQWTFGGTQTADWFDVTATHEAATFDGLAVLSTMDDGTISDVHLYFDVASVKAQLGKGPKPLASLTPPPWPEVPTQVVEQNGSPDEMRNTAVVRGWLDALDALDRPAYGNSLSEDVEVSAPEAPPSRGREAALRYYDVVHDEMAELETRIDAIWAAGDFVGLEYTMSGEQIAPIGWVPPALDRVVRLQIADIVELRDGRIARVWRYDNLAQANEPGP